jgi:RNA polymerase sigma-70 factor (ECF subfamily)
VSADPHATAPPLDIGALHASHHGWLVGWLHARLRNRADAADIAHDVFLRLLRQPEPQTPRAPRAYLATIAQRLASNLHRRRCLEQAYLEALAALPEDSMPSPEDQLALRETVAQIDDALNTLGPKVKRAFLLAQFEGMGYAAIARQLGVTQRTIVNYVARAMAQCCLHAP